MPRTTKVSQTQLAKELNVSQALISLVLNGRKAGINPETYERIWQHAVKRGYRPKGMHFASSPSVVQPRQIGFILRAPLRLHTPSVYFGHVQHGLHTVAEAKGMASTFIGAEDELDTEKLHRLFHPGHTFQGVVLLGEVSRAFLEQLRKVERRIVAVSARYPGLCHSVLGNEPQALDDLVKHLHGFGHRRFGWLGGNSGLGRHEARLTAYRTALDQVGVELPARYCITLEQGDRAEGFEAALAVAEHAKRRDFPTAWVCYNSLMAVGAAKGFAHAGLPVPKTVSVCGADISRAGLENKPRITCAGSSPEKLGEAAARLLLNSTGQPDEPFNDLMLPSQLVPGDSSGPAPSAA